MRVVTLTFLFLATLAAVHAACPTNCMVCPDPTLNQCTLPNPAGGCIAPCTVPKCPQNQNCGINGVWDGVNCQCVVPTAAPSCPTDCVVCNDATLNQCTLPNPAGGCIAPCTVPKCPQNQNCGINGVWDGVNCQCVVATAAPTPVVDPVACPKSCLLCKDKTLNSCWTVDPATNTCVRPCTQPKCPQNQNCGINGVWDGVNCQCVVNTPAPCMGKCSAGFHWDSTNCKCVCTEVQMCVKGKHFDATKCACVDNQPTKPVCVDVVDCLEGSAWNPVDCKCERNVQCLVDPCANKKCEFGACVSNFAGGCNAFCPCDPNGAATCKSGEWWNSQSCTCEQCVDKVACIRGTHWSPLACKCVPN